MNSHSKFFQRLLAVIIFVLALLFFLWALTWVNSYGDRSQLLSGSAVLRG